LLWLVWHVVAWLLQSGSSYCDPRLLLCVVTI
jgi:hypothetical protein